MSDNAELGARLSLTVDKSANAETSAALKAAAAQTEALTAANGKAAEAEKKAALAAKEHALASKQVAEAIATIDRQKSLDVVAQKWARIAKETKNAKAATKELTDELIRMNASQSEIESTAGAFAQAGNATSRNKLARFGSELRALPSTQIPGLGIGSDAIGNIARLGGAIGQLGEKVPIVTTVANLATPALGATAAGIVGLTVAASLFLIPLAAVALAFKLTADEAARQQAVIEGIVNAQRSMDERINAGATSAELNTERALMVKNLEDEEERLKTLNQQYDENFKAADGFVDPVIALISGTEEGLSNSINTTTGKITDLKTGIATLDDGLASTELAANDAAEALKKEAEAKTKATLDSAAAAGQEIQARSRADKASFEQNETRLQAIEDEKAAIQAQLEVLTASGDTSEEVTGAIDKLNGSLSALGKESAYITDTALAASKARDAEKKAIKDAEKAREEAIKKLQQADEKRLAAGKKYTESLIDIATNAADAAEDALQGMQDKLASNQTGFERDIAALSVKAGQSRLEAEIEQQQEEAADLREHQRDLESIRDDAAKNEEDALKKRDFLAAARIREGANREIEAANRGFQETQAEKDTGNEEARSKEDRELDYARQARFLSLQQQNEDARTSYDQALRNAGIAQERQERDAASNRDRELAAAQELADSVTAVKQQQGDLELQIAQNTFAGIAAMAGQYQPPQMNYAGASQGSTFNSSQTIRNSTINAPISTVNSKQQMQTWAFEVLSEAGVIN